MKKIYKYLPFVILFLIPILIYQGVHKSSWTSNSDVHSLLEFASSLVALTAGIMVLLHFITTGRLFFLIISIGFILVGAEEFVHAIFSFTRIWPVLLQNSKLYISATWLTGSFLLVISFYVAIIFRKKEIVKEKRNLYAVVCIVVAFIFSVFITWIIIHSSFLPNFVQVGQIYKQLIELFLSVLFFVAFVFYLNLYYKQPSRSPLLWSIIACIIFMALTHFFIIYVQTLYDVHWDIAHVTKLLSYFFPIFGIWGETILLHRSSQLQYKELVIQTNEHKQAEEEIRKLNESLEIKVEERTEQLSEINKKLISEIEERKQMQEKLLVAERLIAIGQFSGNIAHEIRNPLATIDSSVFYLKEKLKDAEEKVKEHLNRIKSSTDSASAIIQSVLNMTRMKDPQLETGNLINIISDAVASSKLPDTIDVIQNFYDEQILINADREQIRIVFKNIIKNAAEAMDYKGTLTITACKTPDDKIELSFSDTGSGIASENINKIFEPLFTTKAKGIGFGLSMSKMIVEKHHGIIEARSESGKGTTIIVKLPLKL